MHDFFNESKKKKKQQQQKKKHCTRLQINGFQKFVIHGGNFRAQTLLRFVDFCFLVEKFL